MSKEKIPQAKEQYDDYWESAIHSLSRSLLLGDNKGGGTVLLLRADQSPEKLLQDLETKLVQQSRKYLEEDAHLLIIRIPSLHLGTDQEQSVSEWAAMVRREVKNPLPLQKETEFRVFLFDFTALDHEHQVACISVLNTIRDPLLRCQGHALILSSAETYAKPLGTHPGISTCRDLLSCTTNDFMFKEENA